MPLPTPAEQKRLEVIEKKAFPFWEMQKREGLRVAIAVDGRLSKEENDRSNRIVVEMTRNTTTGPSLSSAQVDSNRPATLSTDQIGHVYAEIETSKGSIEA